jgi:hypothetical protein
MDMMVGETWDQRPSMSVECPCSRRKARSDPCDKSIFDKDIAARSAFHFYIADNKGAGGVHA